MPIYILLIIWEIVNSQAPMDLKKENEFFIFKEVIWRQWKGQLLFCLQQQHLLARLGEQDKGKKKIKI